MLTYLINVTSDMLALSVILGVVYAFIDHYCTDKGRMIFRSGVLLGVIAAGIRTYITNTRRLTGGWKVGTYGYGALLFALVLTVVIIAVFARFFFFGKKKRPIYTVSEIFVSVCIALLAAVYFYCSIPNVLVYPFKFDTGGQGVLSTEYLFRLGGYLSGLIICFVSAAAVNKICAVAAKKGYGKLLCAVFFTMNILFGINGFAKLMSVLTARKIVDSTELFRFSAWSNNHSHWYTYILFVIMSAAAIFLWIKSCTAKEPYSTNAEHRKQRAVWRTGRRSTIVLAICFLMCVLCSTLFVKLNTVVIKEAPVENPIINGDTLVVPLEMVEDGHLHRFGYTTEEGNLVRFIVVLKQENTNNYGVGLDACDICGEAGYYENKDNQIVCKKCNVVMNKTTIGMKGGCNPIIIDYDIDENGITVPISEMVKNQSKFKN